MRRPDTLARKSEDLPASIWFSPSREGRGLSKPLKFRHQLASVSSAGAGAGREPCDPVRFTRKTPPGISGSSFCADLAPAARPRCACTAIEDRLPAVQPPQAARFCRSHGSR